MSYARFSDESDVYVFETVDGVLDCCNCRLLPSTFHYLTHTAQEMREHLRVHIVAGDKVPENLIDALLDPMTIDQRRLDEGYTLINAERRAKGLPEVPNPFEEDVCAPKVKTTAKDLSKSEPQAAISVDSTIGTKPRTGLRRMTGKRSRLLVLVGVGFALFGWCMIWVVRGSKHVGFTKTYLEGSDGS